MLIRKTVLDQIELCASGIVQVRLALQIIDGEMIISNKWHRTSIDITTDAIKQMDYVNINLTEMGENTLSESEIAKIERVVLAHRKDNS